MDGLILIEDVDNVFYIRNCKIITVSNIQHLKAKVETNLCTKQIQSLRRQML